MVERLFGGTTPLTTALRPLVQAAEQTLEGDDANRRRTLWRIDAGGGRVAAVNGLLDRGYVFFFAVGAYATGGIRSIAKLIRAHGRRPWPRVAQPGWRPRAVPSARAAG